MDNTSVGKCRYCSNQIFYSGGKTLVTCPKCGETLVVAEFINEKKKLDDALAEGKKAREALQEAERERDEAQQKLLKTLTVIEQLSDGQADSQRKLTQILENQGVNAEGQEAAISLLCNIYKGQAQDRDVLTSLFREAMRNQKTAEEKLYSLQAAAEAISKSQNNISDLLQAVSNYLDTDVINRNRQIGELVSWTQSAHKEDVVRLEAISRTTLELASGQEKIGSRISELREAVAKTELAVRDFEKNWQQSELRKLMDLYQQAENCQMDREFERAEELYQQVLAFGGRDPEVYWRLILCHYCVVYQQDEEGKQVLTILYPDLTDPEDMSVRKELKDCEQSDEQRSYYEKELAKLDKVLNKYRVVRLEQKYDVFISVKQTVWKEGKKYYTRDRELGSILYDHLTGMGLKVFNSEEPACKCPPGQEWEPYILAALLSSKVMIVVGTCAEYMESQWVKNEWQRFQWLQKNENRKGTSERRLFCFISDSMNPYDIPRGLNPSNQAVIESKDAYEIIDKEISSIFSLKCDQNSSQNTLVSLQYSAESGDSDAQFTLGLCYYNGQGTIQNYAKALYWFREAANHENPNAQNKLGKCYFRGQGVSEDWTEAIKWFSKAATKNHPEANRFLGNCYFNGDGVKENIPAAVRCFRIAAEQGDAEAQCNLGYCIEYEMGEKTNLQEAFSWYKRAAEKGYPQAQTWLADCYLEGKGTEKNATKAVYWLEQAVQSGELIAKIRLGNCYYDGIGVTKDGAKAIQLWVTEADKGNSTLQIKIGNCFFEGNGVERDLTEAAIWYRKAAELGDTDGQIRTGDCYLNGMGVKQDYQEAIRWYQKATKYGYEGAFNKLEKCYCLARSFQESGKVEEALPLYLALNEYKDSANRARECQMKRRGLFA